jgi:hypothetical protein
MELEEFHWQPIVPFFAQSREAGVKSEAIRFHSPSPATQQRRPRATHRRHCSKIASKQCRRRRKEQYQRQAIRDESTAPDRDILGRANLCQGSERRLPRRRGQDLRRIGRFPSSEILLIVSWTNCIVATTDVVLTRETGADNCGWPAHGDNNGAKGDRIGDVAVQVTGSGEGGPRALK